MVALALGVAGAADVDGWNLCDERDRVVERFEVDVDPIFGTVPLVDGAPLAADVAEAVVGESGAVVVTPNQPVSASAPAAPAAPVTRRA